MEAVSRRFGQLGAKIHGIQEEVSVFRITQLSRRPSCFVAALPAWCMHTYLLEKDTDQTLRLCVDLLATDCEHTVTGEYLL